MKKQMKRLISISLALALSLSMAAFPVSANDDDEIVQVLTPNTKQIVVDYDQYEGYSLRLPVTVKVRTGDDSVRDIQVTWDTDGLLYGTIGTYSLPGTLDAADLLTNGITNPQNLQPTQSVNVVAPANLLTNPGFEDADISMWNAGSNTGTRARVTDYYRDGSASLRSMGHSQGYHVGGQSITNALIANGPGEYHFGGHSRLADSDDGSYGVFRFIVAYAADGGANDSTQLFSSYIPEVNRPDPAGYAASVALGRGQNQLANDDWVYVYNRALILWDSSIANARLQPEIMTPFPTTVYFDDMELIPLNTTLPSKNISSFSNPAPISAEQGTAFGDLDLPASLNVTLEDGSSVSVDVIWSPDGYDGDTPDTYIIDGTFVETTEVFNNNNRRPSVSVRVYASNASPGKTYYFSAAGDNANDGESAALPKRSLTQAFINELMPGDQVLFNRGDEWYDPATRWDFTGIKGTEEWPIVIGAYGTGDAPVIAAMKLIDTAWTDGGGGAWSTPYAQTDAVRVYVDGEIAAPALTAGGVAGMADGTWIVSGGNLYLKGYGDPGSRSVEMIASTATPSGTNSLGGSIANNMIRFNDSEFITISGITFKGTSGGSGMWLNFSAQAPTEGIVYSGITLRQIIKYGIQFNSAGGAAAGATNKDLIVENSHIDRVWSEDAYRNMMENGMSSSDALTCDGIDVRNACEGAVVRNNFVTNFGHTAISFAQVDAVAGHPGVFGNLIEGNVIVIGAAQYCRGFEFSGDAKVHSNIFRHNYVYGMTNSGHLLGRDNAVYGNIFDNVRRTTAGTTTIQPYSLDMMPWDGSGSNRISEGNIIINNTFFDQWENAIRVNSPRVGKNLIANNIFHTWNGGAAIDVGTVASPQVIMNNVFWNGSGTYNSIRQGGTNLTVEAANMLANISGNMQGDPLLTNISGDWAGYDFTLQGNSPYLHAGLPIADIPPSEWPAVSLVAAGYSDFNGNPFAAYAPTIGAINHQGAAVDPGRNLIRNPGFENANGVFDGSWVMSTSGNRQNIPDDNGLGPEHVYRGTTSARIFNRTADINSVQQDITAALNENGPGDYYVEVYAKQGDGDPLNGFIQLQVNATFNTTDNSAALTGTQYISTNFAPAALRPLDYTQRNFALNTETYTKISGKIWLDFQPGTVQPYQIYNHNIIYFRDTTSVGGARAEVYLDDWLMIKCYDIVSAASVEDITVQTGTALADLGLPRSIEVTYDDGSGTDTRILPVEWAGTYDPGTEGNYSLTGTIDTSGAIDLSNRRNNVTVPVTVTVKGDLLIGQVLPVKDISVMHGTSLATVLSRLPGKADVLLEDSSYASLDVTWDEGSYDPGTPGDYVFTGTFGTVPGIVTAGVEFHVTVTVMAPFGIGDNIVQNGGFEEDPAASADWGMWGGAVDWATSVENVYEGNGAMSFTYNANSWTTPVQNISEQVVALGQGTYYVELWAKVPSGHPAQTIAPNVVINDSFHQPGNNNIRLFVEEQEVTLQPGDDWTKISGYITVNWRDPLRTEDPGAPYNTARVALILGTRTGASFQEGVVLFDNVSMSLVELLDNPLFEDGTIAPWTQGGDATSATLTRETGAGNFHFLLAMPTTLFAPQFYHGIAAVGSVGRSDEYNGPMQDVTANVKINGGGEYRLTGFARTASGSGALQLGLRVTPAGGGIPAEYMIPAAALTASYSKFEGTVTLPDSVAAADEISFIVKTPGPGIPDTVFFDDFGLIYLGEGTPPPTGDTMYFSSLTGNDANHGLSEDSPKRSIADIGYYLRQGYSVMLERGSRWYLPVERWYLNDIQGTQADPLVIGAYGTGSKPDVAFFKLLESADWNSEGGGIFSADVENLYDFFKSDAFNDNSGRDDAVMYAIMDGDVWTKTVKTPDNLLEGEFSVQSDKRIYIKTGGSAPAKAELANGNVYHLPGVSDWGPRIFGMNTEHLTIENLTIRGGSGSHCIIGFYAPTADITIQDCEILDSHSYGIVFNVPLTNPGMDTNLRPKILRTVLDRRGTGTFNTGDAVDFRNGVSYGLVSEVEIYNYGHCTVSFQCEDNQTTLTVPGVHYNVFENSIVDTRDNFGYGRAFTIQGREGVTTNNIVRNNRFYNNTTSAHLLGNDNAVYGNVFSNIRRYMQNQNQPHGIDLIPWGQHVSRGNVVANNTFYDMPNGIVIEGGANVSDNLIVNNLFVNWDGDLVTGTRSNYRFGAAFWTNNSSVEVRSNGFWNVTARTDTNPAGPGPAIRWLSDANAYDPGQANDAQPGFSGNINADPLFTDVDVDGLNAAVAAHGPITSENYKPAWGGDHQDFSLAPGSPYRFAGLPLDSVDAVKFPAVTAIKTQYTDVWGDPYSTYAPSIGAVSYQPFLAGDIESADAIGDLPVQAGTPRSQLSLPTHVWVTLDNAERFQVPVTEWAGAYDGNVPAAYPLTAQLDISALPGITNTQMIEASITVVVQDVEIVSIPAISLRVAVLRNTGEADVIARLPASATVTLEGNAQEELAISWASAGYNPAVAGEYAFTGTFVLTQGVLNTGDHKYAVTVAVIDAMKGDELLFNGDFALNDGIAAEGWDMIWGSDSVIELTTDPDNPFGADAPVIMVDPPGSGWRMPRQIVTDQVSAFGDGYYLLESWVKSLGAPISVNTMIHVDVNTKRFYSQKTTVGSEWTKVSSYILVQLEEGDGRVDVGLITERVPAGTGYMVAHGSLRYIGDADDLAAWEKDALTFDMIKGSNTSENYIAYDLALPAEGAVPAVWVNQYAGGSANQNPATVPVAISWASDTPGVISGTGEVNRPASGAGDALVELTATISFEGADIDKVFTLLVPEYGTPCDINGHTFDEWEETTPPTCGEAGEDTEKCSVCGNLGTVTREGAPATGLHTFNQWQITKPATATTAGEETEKCSVCGELGTQTRPIPPTGGGGSGGTRPPAPVTPSPSTPVTPAEPDPVPDQGQPLSSETVEARAVGEETAGAVADAVGELAADYEERLGAAVAQAAEAVEVTVATGNTIAIFELPGDADYAAVTTMAILTEDGSLTAVPTRVDEDGTVRVLLREAGDYVLVPLHVDAGFTDIDRTAPHVQREILRAAAMMIVEGRGGGIFAPGDAVTVRDSVTMLLRAAGIPVKWETALDTAVSLGFLQAGMNPTTVMTRIDTASLIANLLRGYGAAPELTPEEIDTLLAGFSDVGGLTTDQREDLAITVALGIFQGNGDGTMTPGQVLQRAHIASLSIRFQEVIFALGQ